VFIEAELSGFCARVTVAHRYVNREGKPIEAVYVFPLDEGAAVCAFGRSDAEALNPPVAWTVAYGLDLAVRMSMPGNGWAWLDAARRFLTV
jgi:hypothetical protein